MRKIKTAATVFELPQKLGILQHVEYEPCSGCIYTGLLTAEGCKKGVCIKYRVWASSRDGRRWEVKEKWKKRRDEESGGCLRQQIADALMELAECGFAVEVSGECNIVINGVVIPRPRCRAVDECARQMLEEYKKRLEGPPPPRRGPEEEEYEVLLQQYLWLRLWRRDLVIALLRHSRQALLDVLQRLSNPEVPYYVAAFLSRFELDIRCVLAVYRGADGYCVNFCVRDLRPVTYCYERGRGWRAAPQPRFIRLKPLEDGKLVEVYSIGDTELVRVA
jgi:hypothetical protein